MLSKYFYVSFDLVASFRTTAVWKLLNFVLENSLQSTDFLTQYSADCFFKLVQPTHSVLGRQLEPIGGKNNVLLAGKDYVHLPKRSK